MVICLERDLHVAQLMPLPLTVSCFSKIQIGFTFLVLAHPGSPRKRAVKPVCVCVCVCVRACVRACMRVRARSRVCSCVRERVRTELTYLCAWGFGWTVCRQARWNDGQSVWRMIRQTLWQTSASEADILERWERPHLCCTPIHSGSLYLSLYLFCWHHSLKLSSEIKVWDLINMQNVLNHVSDRLIVSCNWRMQGKFLAFGPWWFLYHSKLQRHLWHICFPCICLSKSWSDLFWYLGLMPPKV